MIYAGIDLGGTAIKTGLVSENGEIISRCERETKSGRPAAALIRDMVSSLEEALRAARFSMEDLHSIGVGIPGFADNRQGIGFACDNLSQDPIPFRREFAKLLSIPVALINDADAAALAESRFGAGKGSESCVLLTLGTGLGCGIILNGKPLTGFLGRAGEAGHVVIARDGIPCYCGRRGCAEQYCSATALVRFARQTAAAFPDSALARMEKERGGPLSAREIVDLAKSGDPHAGMVFGDYTRYLALTVDILIKLLDPEVILLGGGVSRAGSFLLDAVKEFIPTGEMGNLRPLPRIELAGLGNDAGIIGAALTAMDEETLTQAKITVMREEIMKIQAEKNNDNLEGAPKKLILFTDIGDTIIDEGTEIRDEADVVVRAECIPGARETALSLRQMGYRIAMVADGLDASFHNTMNQHGLASIFDAWIISENVGAEKPDPAMFEAALEAMGLTDADKYRVLMIGNNVKRDIRGGNRFGIRTILLDWSPRRSFEPEFPEDVPTYRIHRPEELIPLLDTLSAELEP